MKKEISMKALEKDVGQVYQTLPTYPAHTIRRCDSCRKQIVIKSFGSLLVAMPYESEMVQTVYSRRNGLGARLALPFQYFVQKWKQGDSFICGC